jgi:long-chain fatty acid transport protein
MFQEKSQLHAATITLNTSVGEMADSYQFAHAALKLQLADQLSFGLIYDQPFGADAISRFNIIY